MSTPWRVFLGDSDFTQVDSEFSHHSFSGVHRVEGMLLNLLQFLKTPCCSVTHGSFFLLSPWFHSFQEVHRQDPMTNPDWVPQECSLLLISSNQGSFCHVFLCYWWGIRTCFIELLWLSPKSVNLGAFQFSSRKYWGLTCNFDSH